MHGHTNMKAGMTFVETMNYFYVWLLDVTDEKKNFGIHTLVQILKRVFLGMPYFCFTVRTVSNT